ncbi:MAG TPA: threonine synthase [Candidatus Dormibacteraeota bacterium]
MPELFELRCEQCGRRFGNGPHVLCQDCFAPLEVAFDLQAVRAAVSRATIEARATDIWRYRELLPVADGFQGTLPVGYTPLLRAPGLGRRLGSDDLWIKDDAACFPTLSFKDRVVAVALAQARAFGFEVVGCASTGNLANAVAAQAARLGLRAWVLIPADLEPAKVLGTAVYGAQVVRVAGNYDQVNRLCAEIAELHPWGLVNVNLRPYYAEGSKTVGFEIAEQLGWRLPDNVVVPMAGGAQISKIAKAFAELVATGLVEAHPVRLFGAQALGCSPIASAIAEEGSEIIPQIPDTICRSLAIGNPADGYRALGVIRASGGWTGSATDPEIVAGMRLLAAEEGIFGETAAGVTVAVAGQLLRDGRIKAAETTVVCVTGNGLKTTDALVGALPEIALLSPRIEAFEEHLGAVLVNA